MQKTPNFKSFKLVLKKINPKTILVIFSLSIFLLSIFIGVVFGIVKAKNTNARTEEIALTASLGEQYILAQEDIAAERYNAAQKRLVYILEQDPNFPGVADKLVEVVTQMNLAGQTITIEITTTPTLTPTPDTRPIEQLYTEAVNFISNKQWQNAINTFTSLRKSNPDFQVTKVDDYLYLALRYLGVEKILNMGELEEGSYNLALAEKFGPLDGEASSYQNLARMYMYGLSFWEVMPEKAVYYFAQVAAAAPYMQDGSGYTARLRYREALIQYGDQMAADKEWCDAVTQYNLALAIQSDNALQTKITDANKICSPPTATPGTATATVSPTPTTTTIVLVSTPTATLTPEVLATQTTTSNTATATTAPATAEIPTETSAAPTQAPVPSDTPAPPTEVPPTEAPPEVPTQAPAAESTETTST